MSRLLHRTDSTRLAGAAFLPRSHVVAVTAAVGRLHVWERGAEAVAFGVDAIADRRAELLRIGQDSRDGA